MCTGKMRRGALVPPAMVLVVLLLDRCPLPAAAQGTAALTPAQARNAFYCAGVESDGGEPVPDLESDDTFRFAGLQAIWVNATSQMACTAGPAAALVACLGSDDVTTGTLQCFVSEKCGRH